MSKAAVNTKHTRVQKVCTLWTHDDNFSKDEVVFNGEKFAELDVISGSLMQILALKHVTAVRDFQNNSDLAFGIGGQKGHIGDDPQTKTSGSHGGSLRDTLSKRSRRGSVTITFDENGTLIPAGRDVDPEKSYIFVAKPLSADMKSKYPTLQASI
jgi:DEP domain-containing protein 5